MRYPRPPFTPKELFAKGELPLPKDTEPGIYLFKQRLGEWSSLIFEILHPSFGEKESWQNWIRLVPFRGEGFSWIGWSPPEWKKLTFSPFFLRMKSEELLVAGWQPDLLVVVTDKEVIEIPSALEAIKELHSMLTGIKPYSEGKFLQKYVLPYLA